jgi:preprotein translocase subunit SecA
VDPTTSDREEITRLLTEDVLAAYKNREAELGDELMRYLERQILLQIIDNRWREHLYEMDYLREGIHLRGFAQIDPLVAYKNEGFTMFQDLMNSIWEEFARVIFHVEVNIEPADFEPAPASEPDELTYAGGGPEQPSALNEATQASAAPPASAAPGVLPGAAAPAGVAAAGGGNGGASAENPATVVKSDRDKIGRNDPCWCGSGKKYKKCHGA